MNYKIGKYIHTCCHFGTHFLWVVKCNCGAENVLGHHRWTNFFNCFKCKSDCLIKNWFNLRPYDPKIKYPVGDEYSEEKHPLFWGCNQERFSTKI